jgi:hypothetical protein
MVTRGRSLSTYVKAFACDSYFHVWLEVLSLTVPQGESVVLGGTVSNNLTVLPSGYIFQSSFGYSSAFWTKLTDLASCIGVQACVWWGPDRESPFGRITTVYLYPPLRVKRSSGFGSLDAQTRRSD